ncbi:large ribosomal subunit protein uL14m isoform X1 [Phocoena phocoena]|uniref:Large ribosomal subunit protein uL14m n=5 Tax=Odontoceti TaxID=9722 RepID=A0A2U4CJ67_TURTR|nr:39S ribosomal protein L14, mitochondrial isoform X4 [Tursiops truncatus]
MQLAHQGYRINNRVGLFFQGGYYARRQFTLHSWKYVQWKSKDFVGDLPSWDPMAFFTGLWGPFAHVSRALSQRCFSTTGSLGAIQKMTRVRVVDNSALGNTPYHRPPRCIHVYNKNGVGKVGDRILLAIKGQKKKALIVGHRMPGPRMTPRFDSNNVVLIEDNGNPVGTRIKTPIPSSLRQREGEFSKVLAIAQNFV